MKSVGVAIPWNESYREVLRDGAVYYAVQGGSNCVRNTEVRQFRWKLLNSNFLWYCLLCCARTFKLMILWMKKAWQFKRDLFSRAILLYIMLRIKSNPVAFLMKIDLSGFPNSFFRFVKSSPIGNMRHWIRCRSFLKSPKNKQNIKKVFVLFSLTLKNVQMAICDSYASERNM